MPAPDPICASAAKTVSNEAAYYQPFNFTPPDSAELAQILGTSWAICRDTAKNRERYGRCLTPKQYAAAQARAIEARGWARPVEIVIRSLLDYAERYADLNGEPQNGDCLRTIEAARVMLAKARLP